MVCAKCQIGSRRLVSLLEIIQVHAQHYATFLSGLQTAVNKLIQMESEEEFWNDTMFLVSVHQTLVYFEDVCGRNEYPVTGVLVVHVKGLLDVALDKDNPLSQVAQVGLTVLLLSQYLERMRLTFIDELATKLLFQLPSNKKEWFEAPTSNWEKVIERFPGAITDIEEMSKCFALSRYAGAVFHSIQAIEFSLLDFGIFLEVKDHKSGWTAVSNKLDQITKSKFADLSAEHQKHFPFIEQVQGTVSSLKNAWRNKISHAHGKLTLLTSDFSPDIAEEILMATRAFMRRLAVEMPK